MDRYSNRSLLVGALMCVALVVGVFAGFLIDSDESATSPPPTGENAVSGPGPHDEVNGIPVGYARTEEGAVAAAANFVLLNGRDSFLDRDALSAAVSVLAAPAWREQAIQEAHAGVQFVVGRYGNDADLASSVLAYEVADFDVDEVEVNLWTVSVASGSGRPEVEEVWSLVTVGLTWSEGDWKVQALETSVGPSPVDLPATAPERSAESVMSSYDEINDAPRP